MGAAVFITLGFFGVMPWAWVWGAAFALEATAGAVRYYELEKLRKLRAMTIDDIT